ncbi:MAG: hypothetical protein IKB70_00770 [Bacilli bacterium]|nr:hypothetical protein [Bacilli bacterium]
MKKKLTIASILSIFMGVSVFIGNVTKTNEIQANAATNGAVTTIVINDGLKWNFRSIRLANLGYDSGYDWSDFKTFLSKHYGVKQDSASNVKESSSTCYYYNDTNKYAYINIGGTSTTRTHYIPAWIQYAEFKICNNSNEWNHNYLNNVNKYAHSTYSGSGIGSCVGKTVTLKTESGSNNQSVATISSTTNYFDKANITKRFLSNGVAISGDSTETAYKYYDYSSSAPLIIDGYSNDQKWYTNEACTTVYETSLLTGDLILYANYSPVAYQVSEYKVFDGIVESEPFSISQQGESYLPTQPDEEGYFSIGLFADPEGTIPFTGPITSDTTIYHHYEKMLYDYIYLRGLDNDKWSNATDDPTSVHLYVWAENGALLNGAWPGNEITLDDYVCKGVNFDSRGLYRIPLLVNGDEVPAKFIIYTEYNGGTKQSADLTVTFGAYYYINSLVNGSEDKNEIAGNLDVGAQAELVFKVNDARLAATDEYEYEGKTYTNSICSFDQATAVDILDSYDALNSKTIFDGTSFWTNNVENRPDGMGNVQADGNYYGHEIITSLRTLFPQTDPLNALFTSENVNNSGFVVAIIVLVATAGIIVFLVSKKRKSLSK